jgi:hypothetical protein
MSAIASIFDPLGLLGPAVITCKIFMQQLWKLNITWDEDLPLEYKSQWNLIHEQIPKLNEVQINKKVIGCGEVSNKQVHGFPEASERAYAACVYVRSVNDLGEVTVNLLSSKSRVAPIKQVSLPRLELCGALLLTRLIDKIILILNLEVEKIHLWTGMKEQGKVKILFVDKYKQWYRFCVVSNFYLYKNRK